MNKKKTKSVISTDISTTSLPKGIQVKTLQNRLKHVIQMQISKNQDSSFDTKKVATIQNVTHINHGSSDVEKSFCN